VIDILV